MPARRRTHALLNCHRSGCYRYSLCPARSSHRHRSTRLERFISTTSRRWEIPAFRDFGGRVSLGAGSAVLQVFGEFGRRGNIMPPLLKTGLALPPRPHSSAFYGEGGVRPARSAALGGDYVCRRNAGVAHLASAHGLRSTTDAIVRAALNLVDTRETSGRPLAVLLNAGRAAAFEWVSVQEILANSTVRLSLGTGQGLQSHQIRFGEA